MIDATRSPEQDGGKDTREDQRDRITNICIAALISSFILLLLLRLIADEARVPQELWQYTTITPIPLGESGYTVRALIPNQLPFTPSDALETPVIVWIEAPDETVVPGGIALAVHPDEAVLVVDQDGKSASPVLNFGSRLGQGNTRTLYLLQNPSLPATGNRTATLSFSSRTDEWRSRSITLPLQSAEAASGESIRSFLFDTSEAWMALLSAAVSGILAWVIYQGQAKQAKELADDQERREKTRLNEKSREDAEREHRAEERQKEQERERERERERAEERRYQREREQREQDRVNEDRKHQDEKRIEELNALMLTNPLAGMQRLEQLYAMEGSGTAKIAEINAQALLGKHAEIDIVHTGEFHSSDVGHHFKTRSEAQIHTPQSSTLKEMLDAYVRHNLVDLERILVPEINECYRQHRTGDAMVISKVISRLKIPQIRDLTVVLEELSGADIHESRTMVDAAIKLWNEYNILSWELVVRTLQRADKAAVETCFRELEGNRRSLLMGDPRLRDLPELSEWRVET